MQNPSPNNSVPASARHAWLILGLLVVSIFSLASKTNAQAPNLTNGEPRLDNLYWNLGPTGMSGWFYRPNWTAKYDGWNTEFARQIEVITVDAGSPADGILQVADVILGADGTGASPAAFTGDARKAFAHAIADAEASSPAILKLLVWRAGTTSTMSLTLETLGAYSATAPYNCPKSAAILEKGLDAVMAGGGTDEWKFSLITLLAGNDPSNPDNAARMARAQQEAHALILTPAQIAEYTAPEPLSFSKVAWAIGFKLTALAEYYLHTGDQAVYDSLRAYAIAAANGQTMFGTSGHQFAKKAADGSLNGPYGIGYGVVNSANMQCFLGLTLAKEAGITDQAVLDAVERASNFYSSYVDRGTIPYGEHGPGKDYGDNGKSGIAALCFKAEGTRNDAANYYATLAASAAHNLDAGHQGPWLNYLWSPLGANAAGEEAMAAFFAEQRWRFDLARNWDGTFTYNSYQNGGQGGYGSPTWTVKNFQMSQTMLLPYAAPLRETYLTGKNTTDPAKWVSASVLDDVQVSSGYDATTRTTNELLADLGNWSPVTRIATAAEIGQRTSEHATLLPALHSMATDANASLQSRMGACQALGGILDDSSVPLLVGLLTDPDSRVKWAAAAALPKFSQNALMAEVDAIMTVCIAEAKPVVPIDTEDPVHITHREIVELLFDKMLRSHDLVGIDRDLLIPAIRAGAAHPMGAVRSDVGIMYSKLSREEVEGLADVLVDGTLYEAPADRMFSGAVRIAGLDAMQAHNFAEGVPMAMKLALELNSTEALDTLIGYAANSLLVEPDHKVLEWLDIVEAGDASQVFTAASNWPNPGTHNHIQWVRDAIAADPGPYEKPEALKRIYTVYADDATLTLPDFWTGLHVGAYDFALGDSVFTWRKVHGAGEVNFYPNGTAAAKDTTVFFNGTPGEYLFEVKMSDSRGFSEVTQTVAVTLEKVGGGLDPNSAPTANDQSVMAEQGTPIQIILTGSDPEAHALNYTVTSGPSHGTLSGTAPSLVYTASAGYTGSDSISFEVMDSEGQVDSGTVSIAVNAGAPVSLAIYEPFEGYPTGTNINGLSGTGEIGLAGTWTAGADIYPEDPGYTYGPLPATGSRLWLRGMNSPGQSRPIHPDALTNSGLLADGATLWFSMLIGADDTHLRNVQIALSNASFGSTKNFILDDGAEPGTGLGFELNADKQFYAVQFFDATQGTGDAAPLRGDFDVSAAGQFVRFGDLRMVVGKITWGAASDTVEMYLPLLPEAGASIVLPDKPSSTLVANVDQSKFDVLTVSRGTNVWVDEIRFGSTLQSVLMGTVDAGGNANDGVAPAPDPMTFAIAPSVSSKDSITMTATPAYDPLGVEYYFTCTAGAGGSDSGWQDSNVYTDTGLTPGVAYSYTVKARDKAPGLNETAASSTASATIPTLGTVPNVVGIEQSIAETLLADAGMALGTVTDAVAYSLTVPAGHVLSQSPVGPAPSAYATAVDLEISIGQDPALPTLARVDIVDDKGGLPVTLPATINYTLTFSQDMDAATIDAGDFVNLGDLPIVIGSINEIAPGVVSVEVIPNSIDGGVLLFAVAQGAVIQDALGNALNASSPIVDEEAISVVRPGNYAPTVDAGPDQTVSMDTPQPWSPYLMNAAAWYDAADAATLSVAAGKVSQWADKSGNGNHASQANASTRPSYNSSDARLNNLPTIGYDHAFKTLVTGNSFSAQRAYVVTYYDQAIFGSWHNAVTDKGNTIRFVGGNANQNYLTSGPAKTGTAYQNGDRSANLVDGSNPAVLPMSSSVWTVTANAPSLDQWTLLGGSLNYTGWEKGALAEVILTDGTESLETQQMVEGYLAHKWGLEASLAADHPYKLEAPTSPAALAVLDATVNDNDNDALTTLWTMVSGPQGVTFGEGSSVDTTATFVEAGTYVLQLSADDSTQVVSDQVTITVNAGSDTTPPTLSSSDIVDDRGGLDVSENDLVTYTVTFSEDMNAATVTAADFSNAGSSTISIGAITETSPGVFTVEVTPTDLGSLELQVSAGAVLTDLSGNDLDTSSAIVDDTIINVVAAGSNAPPAFVADPFSAGDATAGLAYTDAISGSATDVNVGDTLSFTKSGGPAWLNVAVNGDLTGTPGSGDLGLNAFTVSVSDGNGGSDTATLNITVNEVVVNNPPAVDAGPDQAVGLIAGGGSWTPAELSTAAWYDAADVATITGSGGAVSNWLDKSGNGKHASQSNSSLRPISGTRNIGGKNAIDFEVTSSQSLNMPTINVIGKEVWAVFVFDSYATTNSQLLLGGGGNVQIGVNSASQNLRLWKASNPYSADSKSTATVPVLTPALAGWLAHTGYKKYAVNGVLENTSNSYNSGDLSPSQIGRGQYTAMDGAIGEIVITSSELSAEDREKMEGYLAHKWGLAANLPAGHPYKSSAPTGGSAAVANLDGTVSDPDGDSYTTGWTVVSGPAGVTFGDASAEDTTATFTALGTYILELTADDSTDQASDQVTITVDDGSDTTSPTLAGTDIVDDQGGANVTENSLLTYTVTFSEDMDETTVDAGDFSNAGTASVTIGTIAETTPGVFTVEVTPTTAGTLQLQVSAAAVLTDAAGNALDTASAISDDTTITVQVLNVASVWVSDPVDEDDALEDTSYSSTLSDDASDGNGDPLSFAKVSGPDWLNVAANGDLSGTPSNADVGANSFTVSVSDSIAPAVEATLNITVINTNDAPVFLADPIAGSDAAEDFAYSGSIAGSASDEDAGDTLTYAKVSGPAWLGVAANGALSGLPGNGDVGMNVFTVSASDGTATPVEATLNITVINTNDAPLWTSNPVNEADATEDAAYSSSLTDNTVDIDPGASLTYAKVNGPTWLSVGTGGALSGTPTNDDVGANVFTVSVSDGIASPVQATLNITVTNVNDAPVFAADPIAGSDATEDAAYAGTIAGSATDVDSGDTLTYAKVSGPAWLSVGADGSLSGTPTNADVGSNSFTVSATDGTAPPVQAGLNITVINTNDEPVFAQDPIFAADATQNVPYAGSIAGSASDDDGDAVTYAKVSGPVWLGVASDGTLSGTPGSDDVGSNSFVVSAGDGISPATEAALNITVNAAMTTVPNVVGLTQAGAESAINAANLVAGGVSAQYDEVVPEGDVISQNPAGGASVAEGSSVDLVVSLGAPMATVPNVVGLPQGAAEADIVAANLTVGTVTQEHSETIAAGVVISQGLSAGADVPEGSAVDLVVSLGTDVSPKLVRTTVNSVSNTLWTTVSLGQTYSSPVIVATPIYAPGVTIPVVTRITNVTSTSFDLKLDRVDGLSAPVSFNVSVLAVDEGVYTQAGNGVTMEAARFTSTVTAYGQNNWVAEARALQNSYTSPVVVGQVMSANDSNWSVFWSMGLARTEPVDAANFNVGKHVGQDSNKVRANETIGYIVIESGSGAIDGIAYEAGVGADIVQCFGDSSTPYGYSLSGSLNSVSTAAVSQAGMDGNDGSWAVLSGSPAATTTGLKLHLAEDSLKDSRQKHTSEQVGYIVFE